MRPHLVSDQSSDQSVPKIGMEFRLNSIAFLKGLIRWMVSFEVTFLAHCVLIQSGRFAGAQILERCPPWS